MALFRLAAPLLLDLISQGNVLVINIKAPQSHKDFRLGKILTSVTARCHRKILARW